MSPYRTVVPAILLFAAACGSSMAGWDPLAKEWPRPELPDGVDPNDSYQVYRFAESVLERSPNRAAEAFQWASRLDPLWADPIYARRVAIFMANPRVFVDYVFDRRKVAHAPGVVGLDSLYHVALQLNPFLQPRHDVQAIKYALVRNIEQEIRRENPTAMLSRTAIEYELENQLRRARPDVRAWVAESEGRFPAALELYVTAIDRDSDNPSLYMGLARTQFRLGLYDAAHESFGLGIGMLRDRDEEDLVRLYESKVLLEHSIGLILEQQGDLDGARDAYARALQEDISYAPAHVRLAELALQAGDTATAIGEFALAAEIRPQDAGVGFLHGRLLARAGDLDAAEAELRRAIVLEPLFAAPYLALAEVLDRQGRPAEAAEQYREFLDRSSRSAAERADVERRVQALAGGESAGGEAR